MELDYAEAQYANGVTDAEWDWANLVRFRRTPAEIDIQNLYLQEYIRTGPTQLTLKELSRGYA